VSCLCWSQENRNEDKVAFPQLMRWSPAELPIELIFSVNFRIPSWVRRTPLWKHFLESKFRYAVGVQPVTILRCVLSPSRSFLVNSSLELSFSSGIFELGPATLYAGSAPCRTPTKSTRSSSSSSSSSSFSQVFSDDTFCIFFGGYKGTRLLVRVLLPSPTPQLPSPVPFLFCEALVPPS
jgi:hypothetical protein